MSRARQTHRFPRYAPESLESRLSPSAIVIATDPAPLPVAPATFEVGDPPVIPVTVPIGPAVPA